MKRATVGGSAGNAVKSWATAQSLKSLQDVLYRRFVASERALEMKVLAFSRRGWRNRRGTQLQHRELWTELIELNTSLPIRWKWVKGHSGHRDQSRADELAYEAARSLRVQQKVAA